MYKTCNYCSKQFSSMRHCKIHVSKRVCLNKIENKWEKIKKNMKICERCGLVLSSQYSLDKHLTKQVPCKAKDLHKSFVDLQKEYYDKDKNGRKKFQIKMEIIAEKLGIDISKGNQTIDLTKKPLIIEEKEEYYENMSNEELLIILKEKNECIKKASLWIDTSWELMKTICPENIVSENITEETENSDVKEPEEDKDFTEQQVDFYPSFIGVLTLKKENKDWDNLLDKYEKKYGSLDNFLIGNWDKSNYILSPVRHYADCYKRQLLVRNMKSSKMLTSIICPYFYPKYKSSLNTKVYIDTTKKKKVWLRDENDKWHSLSFSKGFKNLIFHAVTAFIDIIRREKELLSEESISLWEEEQMSLQNPMDENYKIVVKNLISRIPKLSIHPEEEEKNLVSKYLLNDDYRIDILSDLSEEIPGYSSLPYTQQELILEKRVIHDIRHKNKIATAKQFHNEVIDYYKQVSN